MKVITNGNVVSIIDADQVGSELPVGTYAVSFSQNKGYFLTRREEFELPEKIYGSTTFPERVLRTFKARKRGMGTLLSGPKGTGKTVEAKTVCKNSKMPVILVTDDWKGAGFSEFLDSIKTPSVIFIDEFEKVYDDEEGRNFFLSVMDGTSSSRHLFILTSNEANIGKYFESRPGRVRYHKKYDYLDDEMINAIVDDRLINKAHTAKVKAALLKIQSLSVDSAVSIVDECNIHDETPDRFVSFFNVKSERGGFFEVELKTTDWDVKPNITDEAEITLTKHMIRRFTAGYFDEDDAEFKKLCKAAVKKEIVFKSSFTDPYMYADEDAAEGIAPRLYISSLKAGGMDSRTRHIDWEPENIESYNESRKGFTAVHNNGDILVGKPVKCFRSAW